jgi:predicted ATPase/class 3 adenylate cyclase
MPNLPTGTITFLFTDIEGSTELWEEHPEAMRLALARHDALLRIAIEQYDGHVFKTIGDAFCAAFHTAPDALNAALSAQQALIFERGPESAALRVRMALHTGAAEVRDNDYFGQPLNRVARLLSAGYGGQVLLSDVAHDLTRDTLPVGVALHSLGEHRLRDLSRPESVFQLQHADLPTQFPPLKSLDNPALPNNLPLQLNSFVGREEEMETIETLLSKTRLLTLTGSGGSGKSRLSLQVAAEVLEQYQDGVWLVELAPLADPALVPQTVAQVLGITEQAGKSYIQILTESLKSKHLLLLLDNCEHVLSASAQLSEALLRTCPHVKILASSREGLGIGGELSYRVPSLSLPDLKQKATIESVRQYEAVRLFIERALCHLPAFAVTNRNAPALASVCHRLDGIPLAIELAAARVRSLTVEEIDTRLDNRFRLLTGGSKTALPRQQTLRALIDWSYDLLNAQEKALLVRLSVFAGGWTLDSAEQVGTGASAGGESIQGWEILDLLTSLSDKSLVLAETSGASTRYRLLETVRQYAREKLAASGAGEATGERHRDFFLALTEETQPKLLGSEQAHWFSVLEEEHDNLRAALTFCLETSEGAEKGLRIGAALQQFWWTYGYLSEGRAQLAALLSHSGAQRRNKARADALNAAGNLAQMQGDYADARALFEASLGIRRELGDKQGIAGSLNNLGTLAFDQGDYASAPTLYEEALALNREVGNRAWEAINLNNLGNLANTLCDDMSARALHEQSLAIRRELGDQQGIAGSLNNLGVAAENLSDYVLARTLHEESLGIRRELGDKWGIAHSLTNLGNLAKRQGDYVLARTLHEESLGLRRELGDKRGIAESLEYHAFLALKEQQGDRAVRMWRAAAALREALGAPVSSSALEEYDQQIAEYRAAPGESAFTAAFHEGVPLTWERAVAYAMGEETQEGERGC